MLNLPAPIRTRVVALAGAVSVAAAVWFTITFVVCVAARAIFPFDLAWMESGMEAMVARLRGGESMYIEPSLTYVPFLYPPLYFVVVHAVERAVPGLLGLPALRSVSAAATVAAAPLKKRLLRGRVAAGMSWALAALVLASYGRFGFWHDMARVDSLFVLLLVAALAAFVEGSGRGSAVAAGVLGGLAILTKQPAIPIILLIGVWWRLRRRTSGRRVVLFVACLPLRASDGAEVAWRDAFLITAAVMIGLRLKVGAATNFFLPLVPLGALTLAARFRRAPAALTVATAAQLLVLFYDPRPAVPTSRDWSAAFEFVRIIREIKGPVFLPQLPGYLRAAGKPPLAQITALTDLDRLRPDLLAELERRLARGDYAAAAPEPDSAANRAPFAETIRRHYWPAVAVAVGGPASRDGLGRVAGIYVRSSVARADAGRVTLLCATAGSGP